MLLQRLLDEGPVVDDVGLAQHVHDVGTGHGDRLLPPVRVERVELLSPRGLSELKRQLGCKPSSRWSYLSWIKDRSFAENFMARTNEAGYYPGSVLPPSVDTAPTSSQIITRNIKNGRYLVLGQQ